LQVFCCGLTLVKTYGNFSSELINPCSAGVFMGIANGLQRPRDVNQIIGDRLRVRRQLLGLTQEEIAERCGLTFQMVSKYENGHSSISVYRLLKFADELEVPLEYLIRGFGKTETIPDDMVSTLAKRNNSEVLRLFDDLEDPAVQAIFVQMLRSYHQNREAEVTSGNLTTGRAER